MKWHFKRATALGALKQGVYFFLGSFVAQCPGEESQTDLTEQATVKWHFIFTFFSRHELHFCKTFIYGDGIFKFDRQSTCSHCFSVNMYYNSVKH